MIRHIWIVTVGLALLPAALAAQTAPAAPAVTSPATQAVKAQFEIIKGVLNKTAAKVGEELYSFKPTPEVRSVGQLIGHIADSQFGICAAAAGQQPPQSGIEKSKTSKAELSKALADSSAYCDTVLAGLNDTKGMESIKAQRAKQAAAALAAPAAATEASTTPAPSTERSWPPN